MFEMIGFHAAQLYLIFRYLHCFFGRKQATIRRSAAMSVVYLAIVCLMDTLSCQYIVQIVLIDLLAQLYHGKQGKKLFAAFLIQGMNLLCETLAVCLLYDGRVDGVYDTAMYYAIFLFMYLCERIMEKFCIRHIKEDTALRHWDLLIFLPIISVIIAFVLIAFDRMDRETGAVVSAGLISLNLIVFYICDELVGAYVKLKERAMVEQQLESYSNQLNIVMKSEECVRGLRHDLKNHLLILQAQAGNGREVWNSIQDLKSQMEEYENYYHTGNEFLDIIIRDKARAAKERGIDFSAVLSLSGTEFLEMLDISAIFGNALDNAIEASLNLPKEQRLITVKGNRIRNMIVISVENNAKDAVFSGATTKKDSFLHGFGIANMKTAVSKYGGECSTKMEDGVFSLKILIPVP